MNFIDAHQLVMFIAAGWLLNLTPGPDVLYIATNALRSGTRAGIVAGLGITAGCFVHIFAAAVGVGALLATSATAFTVLKWIGAAYLMWMGVRMLLSKPSVDGSNSAALAAAQAAPAQHTPLRKVFLGGFWTNVLNPKVALFFLAFLPQFVTPGSTAPALQMLVLSAVFMGMTFAVFVVYGLLANVFRRAVIESPRVQNWLRRSFAAAFAGLGLNLAFAQR